MPGPNNNTTTTGANIDISYALGTNLDMMVTYEMAARIWESYLGDDVTVNLYVGTSSALPTNVAGGALPGFSAYQQYSTVRNSLTNDATSTDDNTAVSNLDSNDYFNVRLRNKELSFYMENSELKLTRANAKAIGMVGGAETMLDGLILMNDLSAHPTVSWDYDAVDTSVSSNQLEALSVALHEVGHVLGYVSGMDAPGLLIAAEDFQASEVETTSSSYYQTLVDNLHNLTPLDLFRRSDHTAGSQTTELTIGSAYFSLDTSSNLGNFSEGTAQQGDGYQASHWKNSTTPLGIMDPTISLGERMTIKELDLRAFDAIGWDRQNLTYSLAALEQAVQDDLVSQAKGVKSFADLQADPGKWDNLQVDRSWDVAEMIFESQVYESIWGGGSGNWQQIADVYESLWGGGGGNWQIIPDKISENALSNLFANKFDVDILNSVSQLMGATGSFSTFEAASADAETSETETPETPEAPVVTPNIPPIDSFTGTPNVSPEDILDQGADELLQGGSLQPEKEDTELNLDVDFGTSGDPFASLGIGNSTDDPLFGGNQAGENGLELAPAGVATWFEGANLGVSVST